eukprot:TRINITY_DN2298_c0_g1_i1.p1 TRINITY_DN2298_c0_g1~~TRINITY_DN2298_c0_g1_i1.p1  ORF type:complete len:706 (-),score=197.83 TRINITY_DN2298_c0_g1_i1:737-2854(-)
MRVPEKMSFEGLLSEGPLPDEASDEIFSSGEVGARRSRERTKMSAVQRLVERRQTRARSNSSSSQLSGKARPEYHRSLSANKTYISIGPGKPTTIRESSPIKKPAQQQDRPRREEAKVRRVSVPIQRSSPLFEGPSLKSSGLLKSFTTEKSFEVNADLRRKTSCVDVPSGIRGKGGSPPESVAKRRISLQERFTARSNAKPRAPSPIPPPRRFVGIKEKTEVRTSATTSSSNVYLNGRRPQPSRRFSQGNLLRSGNVPDGPGSRKPPIAAPRKISLQNCHYPTTKAKDILSQAEEKKEEGNELYKTKKYIDALSKYSEAIVLCPENPAFYGNRSACFMMLGQYSNALEDARRSVSINSEFIKGYVRVAKCCLMLGDVLSAKHAIQQVETLDPGNTSLKAEVLSLEHLENYKSNADAAFRAGDYRKAVYLLNQCHSIASGANDIKVYLAECYAYLGRLDEAKSIVYDILRSNSLDADAIYVKGLCLYYEDVIDKAFSHFQRVLTLAPDHHKAKEVLKKAKLLKQTKDEGNAAFNANKLSEAYKLYSDALLIDPLNSMTNAKLYFNRAIVAAKLGKLEKSIEDCNSALELDSSYLKALMRRAKSYLDIGDYESAVKDYETLAKKDPRNSEYQQLLRNAKMELKRSQRKDYYKILGIRKDANDDEIKKAYRKRALVHHPDRHSNASEKEKIEHEKIFKEIGEAYGVST